ncbi:nicotinate-nucleotide--dimethylbenzimidazole phosphoribosyltransferase [Actinacidiphila acididurans]|uniref:Nicotinate-nucleotide--dimethylbenzimidazole phosphoribosyltransferase n=1 Tax=Actinacidiphila acididurans TaxID=2784346 RepID=A0ABS2U2J6_9ACTN|nr:nicotinate-nucleotide--dimethylbenzimidazole phosphoribosyltransferase [Actinacidiphila acididurans]MBM9509823.1 nicotinate-nucleotide--dimethylbenzimidazole phosphoribosyltransferase [Actinacidiphila acididurans]
MTDTGQIPGEGLPENGVGEVLPPHTDLPGNGVPQQQPAWGTDPQTQAPAGYAAGYPGDAPGYGYLDHPAPPGAGLDDEDDVLLMPGPQGTWSDPQPVPPQPTVQVSEPEPAPYAADTPPPAPDTPVHAPGVPAQAAGPTPRRPLHMGPPMPGDTPSGGVSVRSLADRGPAVPPAPAPDHVGPSGDERAAIPAQQTGEQAASATWPPDSDTPSQHSLIPHADSVVPAQGGFRPESGADAAQAPGAVPAEQAPVDQAPAEQAPAEQAFVEQAPAPAQDAAAAQVPAQAVPAPAGTPAHGIPAAGVAQVPAHAVSVADQAATPAHGIPAAGVAQAPASAAGHATSVADPAGTPAQGIPAAGVAPAPEEAPAHAVSVAESAGTPAHGIPAAGVATAPEPAAADAASAVDPAGTPAHGTPVAPVAEQAAAPVAESAGTPAHAAPPVGPEAAPAADPAGTPAHGIPVAVPAEAAPSAGTAGTPAHGIPVTEGAPAAGAVDAAGTPVPGTPAEPVPAGGPHEAGPAVAEQAVPEAAAAPVPPATEAAEPVGPAAAGPAAEPVAAPAAPESVAPAAAPEGPQAAVQGLAAPGSGQHRAPTEDATATSPAAATEAPAEAVPAPGAPNAVAAPAPEPAQAAQADAPAQAPVPVPVPVSQDATPAAGTPVAAATAQETAPDAGPDDAATAVTPQQPAPVPPAQEAPAGAPASQEPPAAGDAPAAVPLAAAEPEQLQPADGRPAQDPAQGAPEGPDGPAESAAAAEPYDPAVRDAVHRVIRERRDVRNGFRPDPIPHDVLLRVLEAAHTAPSVGHSQPWDFVVIRSEKTREKMHELAMQQRDAYAKTLPKARARQFRELKIEAILDTPVNIVVTADPTRGGRHTLGRHTQPQMAPYSSALAVENLWLAARAEGLGVGWVSFFDERQMVTALGLPEHLEVVAYLCVGYVEEFPDEPELMQAGWSQRRPLSWVVHEEEYGNRALPGEEPHDLLDETLRGIRPLDAKALGEAWERQKRMTKPAGALGMLEIISAQLCGLSRVCPPPIPEPAAVAIFAGDHGVHAQGVTAWPQEVTGQMVANFLGGGAVCNAFANQVGAEVCVVDVGVASELPSTPGLLPRKVRPGTADFTAGPAMTREDALRAIEVGIETARDLVAAGNKALLTGEMGIANTTTSAALVAVFTGADPAEVTGRGTGINDEMHARKVDVVRRALDLHRPDPADPVGVLAAIGGLEHAAMVGLLLGGAALRTPVILDGVSAGAAALVARAIAPEVLAACIAGHRSAEPGHVAALTTLGLRPLVDLDLRLGEGTGALLALPLVQSAARVMHEVATFDAAGVTEKG